MDKESALLEQEAYLFLSQGKFEEAFRLFKRAAEIYRSADNYKQSALCFASAGSCWNRRAGEFSFYNAAVAYEEAAKASRKAGDFEYAAMLYKYAAINHERDGEFFRFSECFYQSKESQRQFLTQYLLFPRRISHIADKDFVANPSKRLKYFWEWLLLTISFLVWGHGERPGKTLMAAIVLILVSAVLYMLGSLDSGTGIFTPGFRQAFYFSAVTFTTVGYGDFIPLGVNKFIAIFEAFSGLFIMPLFIVALSRKYLRI